ncbi:MAG: DUF4355 domain-containing protein [Bacteroidaceae bacterium]|nr:DUF4355 domain-containing protein [Bacteroidaceae bacterium]
MDEFKVIETQEEFDRAIQKRLAQKDKEQAERYKEYMSPEDVASLKGEYDKKFAELNEKLTKAQEKIAGNDQVVTELTNRANAAESDLLKSRIAHESGVPFELAGRLVGSNEEELKADAEKFASFLAPKSAPPLYTSDPNGKQSGDMTAMLNQINQQFMQS